MLNLLCRINIRNRFILINGNNKRMKSKKIRQVENIEKFIDKIDSALVCLPVSVI